MHLSRHKMHTTKFIKTDQQILHSFWFFFSLQIQFSKIYYNRLSHIINCHLMIKLKALTNTFVCLLFQRNQCFSDNHKQYYSQSNNIFKDYYSRRLTVQPRELETFLIRLSQHSFNQSDHRWISLIQNIEERINKFNNYSKVYMLKALVSMGTKISLFDRLYDLLDQQIENLTFQEAAVLLWCLSKTNKATANNFQTVSRLFQHMLTLCLQQDKNPKNIIVSNQLALTDQNSNLVISPMVLSMIFGAMATLRITDKHLLKLLIRNGVRNNLQIFSVTSLTTIMIAFQKLGLRNKRDTLLVYNKIRNKLSQLQLQSLETLQNLAYCVANLCLRQYSQQELKRIEEKTGEQQKMQQMKADMRKFLLWICETILLREQNLKKQTAAKILFYCSKAQAYHSMIWEKAVNLLADKVQDCKVIDLVMALKALSSLNTAQRNLLASQEEAIAKRLWLLESSITGKSLDILVYLFKTKRIHPPSKIAKQFNNLIMEQQSAKIKAKKEQSHNRPNQQRQGSHII